MWHWSPNPVLARIKFKGFSLPHPLKLLIWLLLWGSQALYWFLGIKMHTYIFLLWEASCFVHTHWPLCRKVFTFGWNEKLGNYPNDNIFFCFSVTALLLLFWNCITDMLEYQHTLKCGCCSFVAPSPCRSACQKRRAHPLLLDGLLCREPDLISWS